MNQYDERYHIRRKKVIDEKHILYAKKTSPTLTCGRMITYKKSEGGVQAEHSSKKVVITTY